MKKYIWLAAIIVIVYSVQALFLSAGGIGADSLSYFGIAADFPQVITNLFPLGFPALIKVFQSVFQDYFWASKVLNISMAVCILLFSYFKQFYFKETVLLFTGKTLFFALNLVSSEGSFIFLLYFLIYFFHEKFEEKIKSGTFVFFCFSFNGAVIYGALFGGLHLFRNSILLVISGSQVKTVTNKNRFVSIFMDFWNWYYELFKFQLFYVRKFYGRTSSGRSGTICTYLYFSGYLGNDQCG